jgi:hypothetical protein
MPPEFTRNLREGNMPIRAVPPVVTGGKVTSLAALHMGGVQDRSVARVSLRDRSESTPSGPYSVIARTWTARPSFDRPSPNLPKIITIYASTSLREIQGLEACVLTVKRQRMRGEFHADGSLVSFVTACGSRNRKANACAGEAAQAVRGTYLDNLSSVYTLG